MRLPPTCWPTFLLIASSHGAVPPEVTDLDLNNFDAFMTEHDNVLVHFWAPCVFAASPTIQRHARSAQLLALV